MGRLGRLFESLYAPSPFPLFEDMLADLPLAGQPMHLDFYEVSNTPTAPAYTSLAMCCD